MMIEIYGKSIYLFEIILWKLWLGLPQTTLITSFHISTQVLVGLVKINK